MSDARRVQQYRVDKVLVHISAEPIGFACVEKVLE